MDLLLFLCGVAFGFGFFYVMGRASRRAVPTASLVIVWVMAGVFTLIEGHTAWGAISAATGVTLLWVLQAKFAKLLP